MGKPEVLGAGILEEKAAKTNNLVEHMNHNIKSTTIPLETIDPLDGEDISTLYRGYIEFLPLYRMVLKLACVCECVSTLVHPNGTMFG